ncbi:MAG: hypothetical protein Q7S00_00540 [bacterium]|nr:hypothetical protein [bacterium]
MKKRMRISIRDSLKYPLAFPMTRQRSIVLLALSVIPVVGSFLMSPFATAAVSVMTIERDSQADLSQTEIITRTIRAFLAGLVSLLYLLPAVAIAASIGISLAGDQSITLPIALLSIYIVLVIAAWPLAALHAVTQQSAWQALALPRLVWIGLKIDLQTMVKMLSVSILLFLLRLTASFLDLSGFGLLLAPVKAYSEYVFQYLLAASYAGVVASRI